MVHRIAAWVVATSLSLGGACPAGATPHVAQSLPGPDSVGAEPGSSSSSARARTLARLQERLETLSWIAYAPTRFQPDLGIFPPEKSIRQDLEVLYAHGYRGVVTFGSDGTLASIPRVARDVGFEGVIMGLFLYDQRLAAVEIPNAVAAAPYVDGYGIGNEGLRGCGGSRYEPAELVAVMDLLRRETGKPVTTSERMEAYLHGGCLDGFLLTHGDWIFPVLHPFNHAIYEPTRAVSFTNARVRALHAVTDKALMLKETGWPTCGHTAATEANQDAYLRGLQASGDVSFAQMEAFDQPFKARPSLPWEACWGLFRRDRTPKAYASR